MGLLNVTNWIKHGSLVEEKRKKNYIGKANNRSIDGLIKVHVTKGKNRIH